MSGKRFRSYVIALLVFFILGSVVLGQLAYAGEDGSGLAGEGFNLQLLLEIMNYITRYYVEKVDPAAVFLGALRGMVESLRDPYSTYLDPAEFERFRRNLESSFGGIGIYVEARDGYITVVAPIKGTPAYKVGLKAGDRIVAINGEDMRGAPLERAVFLLRGAPGTSVVITVERPEGTEPLFFVISREVIRVPGLEYRMVEDGIGYVQITSFKMDTGDEFRHALRELKALGMKALVLDLRDNGGGLLDEAVSVAEQLIPDGVLVQVQTRDGDLQPITANGTGGKIPLAVLVNEGSASASEIVAGAVQDRGAGIILGSRTYGKATVQTLFDLSNGGAVKLTTARYLTPRGRYIDGQGLTPDVEVERPQVPEPLQVSRTLGPGKVGLDVLQLQRVLNFLGYEAGPEDGVFGSRTLMAVRKYQSRAGVTVTGLAGPDTLDGLNGALREAVKELSSRDLVLKTAVQRLQAELPGGVGEY